MSKGLCTIFGGGGFIGSYLAEHLLDKGYAVTIFEKEYFDKRNIELFKNKINIVEGDFNNRVDIEQAVEGANYIFHLISTTIPSNSMSNFRYDVQTNLVPTINLLESCVKSNSFKKLVFVSSGGTVYGVPEQIPISVSHPRNPISSYGIIKNTIEQYINLFRRTYGLDTLIFRLSNPYGKRQNPYGKQGVIPIFLRKLICDEPIEIWGDGSIIRDYIHIKDAVDLIVKSITVEVSENTYNLGSGLGYSLNDLLSIMQEKLKIKGSIKYINKRIFDVPINILDISKTINDFNWRPIITIEQGIKEVGDYLKENLQSN